MVLTNDVFKVCQHKKKSACKQETCANENSEKEEKKKGTINNKNVVEILDYTIQWPKDTHTFMVLDNLKQCTYRSGFFFHKDL